MAKRRRLDIVADPVAAPETKSMTRLSGAPPIAEVAGQSAALAAAEGLMREITEARADGRLAQAVPLDQITADHLVRDRIGADADEMAALMESIRTHGQRTPLELIETGPEAYGLISGWRRLQALTALYAETGEERFSKALAVLRAPEDAGAAYVAMVEENEIRVGLSYYERARIAALAAKENAFPDAEAAVDALFAAGSKAKRSKIRSFLGVYQGLGDLLTFPGAMNERVGLKVAQALKDGQRKRLRAALTPPQESAEAEATALLAALAPEAAPAPAPEILAPGVEMRLKGQSLTLKGPGVTEDLIARLRAAFRGG